MKVEPIEVDLRGTQRRKARLRRYVDRHLLSDQTFICPNRNTCKRSRRKGDSFREGIMSHVGRRFDLTIGGRPLRIVVVGQESGWPKGPAARNRGRRVSLDARSHAVQYITGLERRYYAEPGDPGRNPHMRGTISALRVIFGKGLGSDFDDEFVVPTNGRPFHIFDGFALVNRLLCSAGPKGSSEGHPSPTMFGACLDHFTATMRILEPPPS